MKCYTCDVEMVERKTTDDAPYPYVLSGLKDVYLVGIVVRWCPKCKGESPVIPGIAELHRVIVETLVRQPRSLTGSEVRFLRKNVGFSAKDFASLLGVTPEHLSRVETGHTKSLGPTADRLARALAIVGGGDKTREILLEVAHKLAGKTKKAPPPVFKLERHRWLVAA